MKKLFTLLAMIMMAIGSMSLTSCTNDDYIGLTLDGCWQGNLYMYTRYGGNTYPSYRSQIEFDANLNMSKGSGYWVDYYNNAPWNYHANHISWEVNNGVITIYFIEDDYYVRIYDYNIDSNYFSGLIEGEDGKKLEFSLRNTSSVNWDSYNYGWQSYGYSKSSTLSRSADADSTSVEKPTLHIGKLDE